MPTQRVTVKALDGTFIDMDFDSDTKTAIPVGAPYKSISPRYPTKLSPFPPSPPQSVQAAPSRPKLDLQPFPGSKIDFKPDSGIDFKPDESPGIDWVEQGIRTLPAVAGSLAGGIAGIPFLGLGSIGGGMAGGAAGAALGDVLGNWYSGKEFSPAEFGVTTALGGVPPILGPAKFAGKGLGAIAKYAGSTALRGGAEGAVVNAAGTPFQHWARTGSFDAPLEEYLSNAGTGGLMGSVLGGGIGAYHGHGLNKGPAPAAPPTKPRISAQQVTKYQAAVAAAKAAGKKPPSVKEILAPSEGAAAGPFGATEAPYIEGEPIHIIDPNATQIANLAEEGLHPTGKTPDGKTIFTKLLKEEQGAIDPEDDPILSLIRYLNKGRKKLSWTDRPDRIGVHGDEAIPEEAYQVDEGKSTQREFSEHFLPDSDIGVRRPGESVNEPISRAEINRETEIAPEESMQEITEMYPSILEEAKLIYNETNPQKISENLARYTTEHDEAWKIFFRAQDDQVRRNIPIPSDIKAAFNRAFRLKNLAQAKYERAATRMIKSGGGFWEDESGTFDWQALKDNLRRLLGREPTQQEVEQEAFKAPRTPPMPGEQTGRIAPFEPKGLRASIPTDELLQFLNSSSVTPELRREIENELRMRGVIPNPEDAPPIGGPLYRGWDWNEPQPPTQQLPPFVREGVPGEPVPTNPMFPDVESVDRLADTAAQQADETAREAERLFGGPPPYGPDVPTGYPSEIIPGMDTARPIPEGQQGLPLGPFRMDRLSEPLGIAGYRDTDLDLGPTPTIEQFRQPRLPFEKEGRRQFSGPEPPPSTADDWHHLSPARMIRYAAELVARGPRTNQEIQDLSEIAKFLNEHPEVREMAVREVSEEGTVKQEAQSGKSQDVFDNEVARINDITDPETLKARYENLKQLADEAREAGDFKNSELFSDLYEHALDRYRAIAGEGAPPPKPLPESPRQIMAAEYDQLLHLKDLYPANTEEGQAVRARIREVEAELFPKEPPTWDKSAMDMLKDKLQANQARQTELQMTYPHLTQDQAFDIMMRENTIARATSPKTIERLIRMSLAKLKEWIPGVKWGWSDTLKRFINDEEGSLDVGKLKEGIRGLFREGPKGEASTAEKAVGLSTAITTTSDLSAAMRQGLPFLLNKQWRGAFREMWKVAFAGDTAAVAKAIDTEIRSKPIFQRKRNLVTGKIEKSFAESIGMKLIEGSNVSKSESDIAGDWVERIPGFGRIAKKSNLAYATFLNHLRANTLEKLLNDSQKMAMEGIQTGRGLAQTGLKGWFGMTEQIGEEAAANLNAYHNIPLAKQLADFVNTATGRGPLRFHAIPIQGTEINLEAMAPFLKYTLFSPRLVASRMRMLNPNTYIMANPFVRQQYMRAMLATASSWFIISGLAKMGGAEVTEDDINSTDFGKIKIGNTRLDPAGGFQQFLVAYARMVSGKFTPGGSTTSRELGAGFQATTRKDVLERFASNKLNPITKFAWDLFDASEYQKFNVGDRIAQLYIPLIYQDMIEILNEEPESWPMLIPAVFGMGTQTYEKGEAEGRILPMLGIPDIEFEGGRMFGPPPPDPNRYSPYRRPIPR